MNLRKYFRMEVEYKKHLTILFSVIYFYYLYEDYRDSEPPERLIGGKVFCWLTRHLEAQNISGKPGMFWAFLFFKI